MAFVDNVSILAFGLLETVSRDRDVVDRERDRLRDPCGQWTVLKTGQRVSPHVEIHILCLEVTETVKLLPNHLFHLFSEALWRVSLELVALVIFELKQILSEDRRVNRVVGIVFDDVKRAYMVQLFWVHSGCNQDRDGLEEDFILDLPEVYEADLDFSNQGRELKFEEHGELKMLRSRLLLDVHFMLIDALVSGPIDALIGAHGVFRGGRLENHSFSKLQDRHLVQRFLARRATLFLLLLERFL